MANEMTDEASGQRRIDIEDARRYAGVTEERFSKIALILDEIDELLAKAKGE